MRSAPDLLLPVSISFRYSSVYSESNQKLAPFDTAVHYYWWNLIVIAWLISFLPFVVVIATATTSISELTDDIEVIALEIITDGPISPN